jgi:DNA-binding NarL/FixJ family response regulator
MTMAATSMRSVLLIDDHRDRRQRLASALLDRGCAIRAFGFDLAASDLATFPCDVVIVNASSLPQGGLRPLEQLLTPTSSRMIIVIVQDTQSPSNQRLLDQGVILVTDRPDVEIRIGALIAPGGVSGQRPLPPSSHSLSANLSPRQQAIIAGVMAGHPNKRIAADIGMSEQMVKNVLTRLYRTFKVRNRVSLINILTQRSGQP